MISIPEVPTCIACSREQKDADGIFSMRPGGSRYWLCFGCVDSLKVIADARRAEWERQATITMVSQ